MCRCSVTRIYTVGTGVESDLMQACGNRHPVVDDLNPCSLLVDVLLDPAKSEVLVPPAQALVEIVQDMHQQVLLLGNEGQHIWARDLHFTPRNASKTRVRGTEVRKERTESHMSVMLTHH